MNLRNDRTIDLKRGETFRLGGTVKGLPSGVWICSAWVKTTGGVVVDHLSATLADTNDPTVRTLVLAMPAASTLLWPAGYLLSDVRFQDASGNVMISRDNYTISVTEAQTNA